MGFGQLYAADNTTAFSEPDKIHHALEGAVEGLHARQRRAGISVCQGPASLQCDTSVHVAAPVQVA
jgi:hypothetical protein